MLLQAEESNGFEKPHILEGLHHAEFISISDAPDGKFGARVALDFKVYPGKAQRPVRIGRVLGKKLTPKSKLWESLEAIGADLMLGAEFDVESLYGKKCRVMIEDYQDGDGKMVSGISKIKPAGEETEAFVEEAKKFMAELKQEPSQAPVDPEVLSIEQVPKIQGQ